MAYATDHPAGEPGMNFTGFPAEGLRFLRALADNNEPGWFKPRRDEYEAEVRGPMLALIADLLTLSAARDARTRRRQSSCRVRHGCRTVPAPASLRCG